MIEKWWSDNLVGVIGIAIAAVSLAHTISKDKKTAKRKPKKQKRRR